MPTFHWNSGSKFGSACIRATLSLTIRTSSATASMWRPGLRPSARREESASRVVFLRTCPVDWSFHSRIAASSNSKTSRVYALGTETIAGLPATPALASEDPSNNGFARWLGKVITPTSPIKSLRWLVLLPVALALAGIGAWQVTKRAQAPHRFEAANQSRGPTIAVLPFDNLSGDPSQEFFSDGISDELMTVLSRFDQLRVLARNTTFAYKRKAIDIEELGRQLQAQYVIEGSVRRIPDQIGVTAQLIDARTGTHVWAQTYERSTASTSLLSLQNDIAYHIGAAIGDSRTGAIAKAELERARAKPATELSSYECVLQGYQASAAQSAAEPMRRARACLEATVKRDPTYAATCQTERMRVEADRVLAINPNDASALGLIGNLLAYAGEWDYGRQLAEKALALAGPAAPSWWWWVIAKDHYRKGEYAKALEVFQRSYAEQNR